MSRRDASTLEAEVFPQMFGSAEPFRVLDGRLGGGIPLGTTRSGKPVSVRLLGPIPSRVVVVGEAWLASMLMLRAAVLGATTVISTERPAPWTQLVQSVGGVEPFATVVRPDALTLPVPSVTAPLLVLHDGGGTATDSGPARSPWQTSLHLLFRLTPQMAALLDATDLIVLPHPGPDDLAETLELLRLPSGMTRQMNRMGAGDFLAVTRQRALFVTAAPTPTERAILRR